MQIWVGFTMILLAFYFLGFLRKHDTDEWMSRDFTTAIKGFSILTVVWAHTGAKLGVGGIQFIAGIGVALFLICSGYGLEVSYEKNGLDGFLKKRLLKVCVPFWIVEFIGLIATGTFNTRTYVLDALFIKQATGYGWFMQYIVICYIIFFVIKSVMERVEFIRTHELTAVMTAFVAWFVIDSLLFANQDMPVLRARQMLCFPPGMLIAKYREQIKLKMNEKPFRLLKFVGGILISTSLMAITQTGIVKAMPYLVSNCMALGTCFVYALVVLAVGAYKPEVFQSKFLTIVGSASYEVYLIHAFTLSLINYTLKSLFLFIIVTTVLTVALHEGTKRVRWT